jgi:hypothetical protein
VSAKTPTALRIDNDILDAMRAMKARDGVPITTQIERAVTEWLTKRGITVQPASRRAGARRKL